MNWNAACLRVREYLCFIISETEKKLLRRQDYKKKRFILSLRDEIRFIKLLDLAPCNGRMPRPERDYDFKIIHASKCEHLLHENGSLCESQYVEQSSC